MDRIPKHSPFYQFASLLLAFFVLAVGFLISTASSAPLQLDTAFNVGTGASSTVYDIVSQPDGTVWVAGAFSSVNGTSHYGVAKLDSTGTVDPTFNTPSSVSTTYCLAPLENGKILIGVNFIGSGSTFRQGIARLNADGSIDSTFNAGSSINSYVYAVAVQTDEKILIGGSFTSGIARLNSDGTPDLTFVPGAGISGSIRTIQILPSEKIMVGGSFSSFNGVARNNLCRLHANGSLDTTFGSLGSGPNSTVYDIESDQDGKLLIAGGFYTFNGLSNKYLARITSDGIPDAGFLPNISSTVYSVAPQTDGRIMIGGDFTTIAGISLQRIAILHADGKPDSTFDSSLGASNTVRRIRVLSNGKALLGGSFSTMATISSKYIAKLIAPGTTTRPAIGTISSRSAEAGTVIQLKGSNLGNVTAVEFAGSMPALFSHVSETEISVTVPVGAISGPITLKSSYGDAASPTAFYPLPVPPGTLDPSFDPGLGANSSVYALAKDSIGRIILAGDFSSMNGLNMDNIVRLNPNGMIDFSFSPPISSSSLRAISLQSDGKLLVGGYSIGGKTGIARLNLDGSADDLFNASAVASNYVYAIAPQPDGRILIGGSFTRRLARLNANGSQDLSFNVGTGLNSDVESVRLQPDGKILAAGSFSDYNGSSAKYLIRLTSTGAIDPSFQITGTGISGTINALALQQDGGIIIGGSFTSINGNSAFARLARLYPNGDLDESFLPGVNSTVNSVEIAPDGRIAIGGAFTSIKGLSRNYAAILHADGVPVTSFNTTGGPSSSVYAVLPEDDGKLLIGGAFSKVAGLAPAYIARLAGDDGKARPAVTKINPDIGAPGDRVTISGSNLGSLTAVDFGGGTTAVIFPISEVQTEVLVPPGAMSGPITVRNSDGESSSTTIFKFIPRPAPVITSIPTGPIAIGNTFPVIGKNFFDVTSVRIGVLTTLFTINSATQMTVTVPTNALTGRVILTGPGGTVESTTELSVIKAPPVITSATIATGVVGQNFSFTIKATNNATGFTANPLPPGLQLNTTTGLISGIPTTDGMTATSVTATNDGGTTTSNLGITISPPPPPIVSLVSPSYVATGGKILVSGDFLVQTTTVTVGGITASFEILSNSRIAVTMPAGVTSGIIMVTTLQGTTSSATSVNQWNFQGGSQVVTGFGENSSGESTPPPGLNDVTVVAAGQYHNLALRADGSVTGWGANWIGQCIPPSNIAPAIAIAAGGHHSLVLQADGSIAAWGRNDEGQCSGASSLSNIAAIAAGSYHSLALMRNGMVRAWGANGSGQTTVAKSLGGVVAIAAGGDFSVALKSDGSVTAWGDNTFGQTDVPSSATGIISISAGMSHVAALKADGTVICWGANWSGQATSPSGLNQVTQISAGSHHTVALRTDGSFVAWGANWSGQASVPSSLNDAVAVAAGGDHSLILHSLSPVPQVTSALVANGKPGQFFSHAPISTNGPIIFTADGLPAGLVISSQSGAITGTPTVGGDYIVTLMARNEFGISRQNLRLLIGPYIIGWGTSVPGPIPQTLSDVVKVAAGTSHCLALLNNGTVSGWGSNTYGEITIPVGLTDVVAIAAGDDFSLALKVDGSVYAWGRNPYSKSSVWTNPISTNVVAIEANGTTATALFNSGTTKVLVSYSPSTSVFGTGLTAITTRPSSPYSYSYSGDSFVAINRSGFIVNYAGTGISTTSGFDQLSSSGSSVSYSSSNLPPVWGVQRDGMLYEFQSSRYSSSTITQILRAETSSATEVSAAGSFALVLNSNATAFTLPISQNSSDFSYGQTIPAPPQPASDTLLQIGAIAAREGYALAIKDSTVRPRFTSLRVTEGRVGQAFSHQLVTSGPVIQYEAALLPSGLSVNQSTGIISGTPQTAGTFNFLVIARHSTFFTCQVMSVKFAQGVAPVDITLTGSTVTEDLPVSSPIGTLAAMDYSPSDTFSYSLVAGSGSTDNSKFKISGNQLLTNAALDFEAKQQLSIRVQVTDSGNNTFAKVFQIKVFNVFTDDDDKDGLTQAEETQLGTDVNSKDSDHDGVGDGQEVMTGFNPLSGASRPTNYVAAWGSNSYGQCNVPTDLGPVIAVAAGNYHTLAVRADGTVAAWGQNSSGQCNVPPGLNNIVSVAAGSSHSVALKTDGTVVAWGSSSYATVPSGLSGVIEISANDYLTAVLKSDGQIVVWGSSSYSTNVVPANALSSAKIAAGYGHILALNQSGNTVSWGDDWQGQTSGPQGHDNLRDLAAGDDLSLGITSDGRVLAWGWDIYDVTDVPATLSSVVKVSTGSRFALAVQSDGSLVAWGQNTDHQTEVPVHIGPVQMAAGGYGHVVALVGSSPPERFLTTSLKAVVGFPIAQQVSYSGTADRFDAAFLPPGISFDTHSGTLTGTPTQIGTFNVRFTAEKGLTRVTNIIQIICDGPRTFEEWSAAQFPGSGPTDVISAPLADPDGDAVCNLLEYALHRNPKAQDPDPSVKMITMQIAGQNYLGLTHVRFKGATDVRYIAEVSNDLSTWFSGRSSTTTVAVTDHDDYEAVTIRDLTPASATSSRFLRLKVEKVEAE